MDNIDLHVRRRLPPAAEERQVRDDPDARRAASGARRRTMPAACSGTSTTRRCSPTSSPRSTTRAIPNLVRTRGLYEPLHLARGLDDLAGPRDARRQPRLSRSVLPSRRQLADDPGRRHAGHLSRRSAAEGAVRRRVHHRLADQPGAPLQDRGRRHRPADGGRRLQEGRDPGVVGRALPAGEPARRPRRHASTSSTCIAASSRSRSTGPTS